MSIKLAIVGMESIVGSCQGIDDLVDSSYEGIQNLSSLPGYGLPGAYLSDFDVDAFELKIPPKDLARFTPEQLLLLTVLYRAVAQSALSFQDQLGVIYPTVAKTESVTPARSQAIVGSESVVKTLQQDLEADVVATKLSHLCRCSVLPLKLEPTADFLFQALNRAQLVLTAGEVGAVAIGGLHLLAEPPFATAETQSSFSGEGAAVIVVKSYEKAIQANDRIYGVIESISPPLKQPTATVGYVELVDREAIADWNPSRLTQMYPLADGGDASEGDRLSCAVGSAQAILGDTGGLADLLGLIHVAVCLYHRYLPPVPQWQAPRSPELWAASPFYVATEARPWLVAGGQARRAALNSREGHVVMAEAHHPHQPRHQGAPVSLFVLGGTDETSLLAQLAAFERRLSETDNVIGLAQEMSLSAQLYADCVLALVGATPDKLLKEIARARTGIQRAFAQGKDWKSPTGSYFTANPQGVKGGVSFVYSGAFNSYLGMGRSLFHRFPQLFDRADRLTADPLAFLRGQQIYPKSQHRLSKRESEAREETLTAGPLALLETGTGFSVLFTEIIHQIFQVNPRSAFGYSMGESTMMYALDVWPNADYGREFVHRSSLFQAQLAGPKTVIRDRWPDADKLRWASYVLLTTPDQVRACLQQIPQVYLTHINTPQEVVIAGCAVQCDCVIAALQCDAFRAPADLVLHCDAMASAYPDLFDLNHVPGLTPSPIQFYSSATYRPLPLEPAAIAQHLATGICRPLDFPQLVNQVYDDGDRIFIELGAGGSCARWIDQILAGKDHTVMGINHRGADDYTTIVKVLAQLVSHRVPLDLLPLYPQAEAVKPRLPQRLSLRPRAVVPRAVVPLPEKTVKKEIFNADQILELTQVGVSRLFGADYAAVDSYARRVRMPSPPFLFVSRVTALSGDRGNYKTGVIETEYDIPEAAWYRHSSDAPLPIGICAEAGHGLLLLLSYLGSDFESGGQRSFRLLDLSSEFVAPPPHPLKTLRYRVKITSHVKTTKSLLVFFEGECWAGETLWMRLSGGCAGLFSDEELAQGQGIVGGSVSGKRSPQPFPPLISPAKTALSERDLAQLSQGDLSVLGDAYQSTANPLLRLPPAQLRMVDRVLRIDANCCSAGLGQLIGAKAITPEDWYFQCHFKNDPTLPGSLMVEGGAQLLQVYMLWLGLQTRTRAAVFRPLPGCKMAFQFRGQVTPATGSLHYQLEVVEVGLEPMPYVIANIRVSWADRTIATINNLGLQLSGEAVSPQLAYDDQALQSLALGRVSDCLGAAYERFDDRRCVRIPNRDFQIVSRVRQISAARELVPGAKIITEYDVAVDSWLYQQNSYPYLPYCAHIEMAGQPCIFLGLHLGTPLLSPSDDLYFRNIDGQATVLKEIDLRGKTVVDEVELTSISVLSGATLQSFAYQLTCEGEAFYRGTMVFGYFSDRVLAQQSGLDRGALAPTWYEASGAAGNGDILDLQDPAIRQRFYQPAKNRPYARLATDHLDLLDRAIVMPAAGQYGQGYLYAEKALSPSDWYVPYHFYQDPVMPGALGIETILQAMQLYALHQGLDQSFSSPRFAQALNHATTWTYRGQLTPENRRLYLEVHLSEIRREAGRLTLIGDASLWKETMRIYAVKNIALCIQEA